MDRPTTYEGAVRVICNGLADLLIKKHGAYGTNLLRHGEPGIRMRIDDKLDRIDHLRGVEPLDSDEPLVETWLDIAGYSVQAAMMRAGTYTLPMHKEPTDDTS